MHMCTHGHETMVTETSKTINFWGRFVYNVVVYWIAILFIGIMFFYCIGVGAGPAGQVLAGLLFSR